MPGLALVMRSCFAVLLLTAAFGPAAAQQWREPEEHAILRIDNLTGETLCISWEWVGGNCNVAPGRTEFRLPTCGLMMDGSPYCSYKVTVHKGATQIGQIVTESGIVTNQYDLSTMWVCSEIYLPLETIKKYLGTSGLKTLLVPWEIAAGVAPGCSPPEIIRR